MFGQPIELGELRSHPGIVLAPAIAKRIHQGAAHSVSSRLRTSKYSCSLNNPRAISAPTEPRHMRSKRAKWFLVAFATLFNLGGGPMAWAHLMGAGNCHESPTPAASPMPADCPEHHGRNAPNNETPLASHDMPCCDGGSCACAVPSSISTSVFPVQHLEVAIASTPKLPFTAATSTIIDDALRPPIS